MQRSHVSSLWERVYTYCSLQITYPALIQARLKALRYQWLDAQMLVPREDPGPEYLAHTTLIYGLNESHYIPLWRWFDQAIHAPIPLVLLPTLAAFTDRDEWDVWYFPVVSPALEWIYPRIRTVTRVTPPRYRTYLPHCTFAYVRKGTQRPLQPLFSRPFEYRALSVDFCCQDTYRIPLPLAIDTV